MEFNTSRGQTPAPARVTPNGTASPASAGGTGGNKSKNNAWHSNPTWMRAAWVIMLFAGTILVVALLVLLYFGGAREQNYIDKSKQQAVFLSNGQVYFGKIKSITKDYVDLQQIYYLNVNQQVQPNQSNGAEKNSNQSVSLVKLGCELHGPTDRMIVNRDQVTFWENLKTDGQVTKAITQWVQQNPRGQDCTQAAASNKAAETPASSSSAKP
jgi:hypothetical protein